MPVEETTNTNITCDNPACPGHPDLDPTVRTGWMFVTHEIYGEPTQSHVFGSAGCVSEASGDKDAAPKLGFVKS
jgi:hypothetical protein